MANQTSPIFPTLPATQQQYLWGWRGTACDQVPQSQGNGYNITQWDGAGYNEVELLGMDASGVIRVGAAGVTPARAQVTCHLFPNANLVAQTFFINPTNKNIYITGARCVLTAPATATATTTATQATVGSTSLTLASGTGTVNGQNIVGAGIPPGTTVVSGGGTTSIVISQGITAALSATSVTFSTLTAMITHETVVGGVQQATGKGKSVLSAPFSAIETAATVVQDSTLAAPYLRSERAVNVANALAGQTGIIVLQPGDSLSFVPSAAWTGATGLTITLTLAPGGAKWHYVSYYLAAGASAATTSLMTSMRPRTLLFGSALWQVAGTDAGAVTLDVTKDASGTAPGAGTSMLSATVNLKSTALTVNTLALSATNANLQTQSTDSVAVKITGTTTALAGVCLTLAFSAGQDEVQFDYNAANSTVGTNEEFAILDRDYLGVDIATKFSTAGGSGATLQVVADSGTQAPSSGNSLMTAAVMTGTINTPLFATLSARHLLYLRNQWRLGLVNAGTTSPLAGAQVSVLLVTK